MCFLAMSASDAVDGSSTGIAMCQNAAVIQEPRMSAFDAVDGSSTGIECRRCAFGLLAVWAYNRNL